MRPADAQSSASTTSISWIQKASAAIGRAEAGGVAVGRMLYVFGGQFTGITQTVRSDRYDPATDTWTRIRDLPELITHAPVVADGNTLWILGGYVGLNDKDSSNRVWKYDIASNTYSAGPALPAARGGGGAAIVGRQLHYLSGAVRMDSTGAATRDFADHWVLNLDGGSSWTASTPVPNPRNHVASVAIGNRIYLIGGQHGEAESTTPQSQVDVFDVATSQWTRLADLPVARSHVSASTFVYNGRILVLGGSVAGASPSRSVYEYDPSTNVWSTLTSIPEALRSPVADVIDGKIVLSGGRSSSGPTTKTWLGTTSVTTPPVTDAGSWSTGPAAPVALLDAGGAAIGGKIYLVAGKTSAGPQSALRIFDTATQSWSTGASMPGTAVESPAVAAVDGKLYVAGGSSAAFSGAVRNAYRYDPATNTWSALASMATARGGAAAAVVGTTIWVIGGMDGGASLRTVEKYDIATNTWSAGPSLATARDNAGAAGVAGRIYAFGGRTRLASGSEVEPTLRSAEMLDTAGGGWVARADMPTGRRAMAVGVIGGRVVAAGGEKRPDGSTFPQTEEYDPAANTWRSLAPMPTPRHGAAAAVVAGRLHAVGGGSTGGSSFRTTHEIFTPSSGGSTAPTSPATPTSPPPGSTAPGPAPAPAPPPVAPAPVAPVAPVAPTAQVPAQAVPAAPAPPAVAPVNTLPPSVRGAARVGERMTCLPGTWTGSSAFAYRWLRNGVAIARATGAVRVLDVADYRQRISCKVTATGPGGGTAAISAAQTVAAGRFSVAAPPVVIGSIVRGGAVTTDGGRWSVAPATYSYQWRRNGVPISRATAAVYSLTRVDTRTPVTVTVTVRRPGYTPASATSVVRVSGRPSLVGPARAGAVVRAAIGRWTPLPTSFVYQWYRDGRPIAGARAAAYRVTAADRGRVLQVIVVARRGRAVVGAVFSRPVRVAR